MEDKLCEQCGIASQRYALCNKCYDAWQNKGFGDVPYFKEMGTENTGDSKGSTAHVRDIKDRRWNSVEKRMFYHSKERPKTYFLPKGKL